MRASEVGIAIVLPMVVAGAGCQWIHGYDAGDGCAQHSFCGTDYVLHSGCDEVPPGVGPPACAPELRADGTVGLHGDLTDAGSALVGSTFPAGAGRSRPVQIAPSRQTHRRMGAKEDRDEINSPSNHSSRTDGLAAPEVG